MFVHAVVIGRVQGVGFRYSTMQKANEYNLSGWVKNKTDGTVELEAEGDEQAVNAFINELKKGFNRFIRVDDLKLDTKEEHKGYTDFSIK
ncbi:acylphosphatase [Virgibacillus doumboii]|uniref:acylphosphatase n=1 Tax=Virgibacillus doumboii TaxID=2697503 RepID=UPI0013DE801C|nr:acylphosphatase [Virgibacillus doumboii]